MMTQISGERLQDHLFVVVVVVLCVCVWGGGGVNLCSNFTFYNFDVKHLFV